MRKAFTLAEVLITLGIIGIVAAMTLPTLINKYQKQETVTRLKKVYTVLAQAYQLSEKDNGFSNEWVDPSASLSTESVKQYVYKYWLPYLKIIRECSKSGDCAYTRCYSPDGKTAGLEMTGSNRYSLILSDGTFIAFVPFSWDGDNHLWGESQRFYIDLNGVKRPNTLGKDVFVLEVNLKKHTIRGFGNANSCKRNDKSGQACAAKIIRDGWKIVDDYPW